jgi:hypothetical protein
MPPNLYGLQGQVSRFSICDEVHCPSVRIVVVSPDN